MEKFILICVVEDDDIFVESVHDSIEDARIAMVDAYNEFHLDNLGISDDDLVEAEDDEDCGIEDFFAWSTIDEYESRRWKIEKIEI